MIGIAVTSITTVSKASHQSAMQMYDVAARTPLGIGVVVVGGLLSLGSLFVDPHPVSASEAREAADTYNKKLKAQLGLPETSATPRASRVVVSALPVLNSHGGGLVLAGIF
jgi:hypothetical protein